VFFAKIIDRLALYDLHRKRSKDQHFSAFLLNLIDRGEFYQAKAADVAIMLHESRKNYLAGHFSYESLIPSGDPVNDALKGEVFLNKNDINQPNVIFVHGWRMDSYDRIKRYFMIVS